MLHALELHGCQITQVDRLATLVGHNELIQLVHRRLAHEANGVLPPAHVRKASRDIGSAADCPHDIGDPHAQRRGTGCIEHNTDFLRPRALQVDLRHTGNPGQRRFDVAFDDGVEFTRIARVLRVDGADQQRGGIAAGEIVARQVHPGSVCIAGQGRHLLQPVNHVQIGALHVVVHLERQIDVAVALTDVRLDMREAGQVAQHALLLLDDHRFHIGRRGATPERGHRDLRLIDRGQQLYRQLEQRCGADADQQQYDDDQRRRIRQ